MEFASVSGKSRVSLPDGSDVTLDTGASVSYEESFGKKTRNITADGRVFFDVFKDKRKPFVIETGGLKIKVLGTKFDVDSRMDEVIVSLVEGSVSLTRIGKEEESIMKPGEVAVYDKKAGKYGSARAMSADPYCGVRSACHSMTRRSTRFAMTCRNGMGSM